ncbi:flagellar biosynthetic protein FliO [Bacillus sp. FSL H8-0547]
MNTKWLWFLLFFCLCLLVNEPVQVFAGQESGTVSDWVKNDRPSGPEAQKEDTAAPGVSAWDFIKMILATGFVLFLIYMLIKFTAGKNRINASSKYIENLGGTNVGQNRSVQLVKVGGSILVVGVSDSVQLLKEIDDEEECKEIVRLHEEKFMQHRVQPEWVKNLSGLAGASSSREEKPLASFKDQLLQLRKDRQSALEDIKRKDSKE